MSNTIVRMLNVNQNKKHLNAVNLLFDSKNISKIVLNSFFTFLDFDADFYSTIKLSSSNSQIPDLLIFKSIKEFTLLRDLNFTHQDTLLQFCSILDYRNTSYDIFEKILHKDFLNNNYLACYFLGRALLRSRIYFRARNIFLHGLSINPNFAPLSRELGLLLYHKNFTNTATFYFQKALNPHNFNSLIINQNLPLFLINPKGNFYIFYYNNFYYLFNFDMISTYFLFRGEMYAFKYKFLFNFLIMNIKRNKFLYYLVRKFKPFIISTNISSNISSNISILNKYFLFKLLFYICLFFLSPFLKASTLKSDKIENLYKYLRP